MKTRYIDLIEQTFDFPKDEFKFENETLTWNDLPLMDILKKHGTPLRITYLPKIGEKIDAGTRPLRQGLQGARLQRHVRVLLLHQEQPLQLCDRHRCWTKA